jgi:hypothetical protein
MKIQEKNNDEHTIDYRLAEINEINWKFNENITYKLFRYKWGGCHCK